ncbi:pyridoxal phosphate-dependent aminotransferase [Desulfogranum japonicum]|uniref:pyridoxal phosphate-dependent aminotransferase n=1 Tax=Desulfogranum japonicum TaxID=231447 RepID=UPI000410D406|nr:pyridoxal phosphate-dependent aminotransferase [Desulfogranum japonicum]
MITRETSPIPASRVTAISSSATKRMAQLAAQAPGCVSLGQGVPSFTPPEQVTEAIIHMLQHNRACHRYTLQNGLPELRHRLADHLYLEKGIKLNPETEICITVGGMEGLLTSILSIAQPGDEIILPCPTYASYIEQVTLSGATPVFVPFDANWQLDMQAMRAALSRRTKAIILCSPGNPTGNILKNADIEILCEIATENNITLLLDEAYDYITYEKEQTTHPLSCEKYRHNVITIGSFSKKYCLTGWRIGWVAADSQWMEQITKVHDATTICAPAMSQYAALTALDVDSKWVEQCCKELEHRRALCCARLDELGDFFSYVPPQGAFYVMAKYRFTDEPAEQVATSIINEARVITIPGDSFGPGGQGHLRLSFGGEREEIDQAFARLKKWLKR